MLSFQRLDVYRCAVEFLAYSRRLRLALPRGNADLIDQLKRASQSIIQNIAEGAGKTTAPERARYYAIARGSVTECAGHLDVMQVEELIGSERYAEGAVLLERLVAMLTRLIDP